MPKNKRDPKPELAEDKNPPGRPKVLPPELDMRHQLRCSSRGFETWQAAAEEAGFPNVSAWIRKVANDAARKVANDAARRANERSRNNVR